MGTRTKFLKAWCLSALRWSRCETPRRRSIQASRPCSWERLATRHCDAAGSGSFLSSGQLLPPLPSALRGSSNVTTCNSQFSHRFFQQGAHPLLLGQGREIEAFRCEPSTSGSASHVSLSTTSPSLQLAEANPAAELRSPFPSSSYKINLSFFLTF